MKKEDVEYYQLQFMDEFGPRGATFPEIKGLMRLLQEIPLDLEPSEAKSIPLHNFITKVDYYPRGGTGSARTPYLIRITPEQNVSALETSPNYSRLSFMHNIKCLCFAYTSKDGRKITIEIDNGKLF